ncbi:hypothetical protein JZU54_02585, partial [bacterium]|nr:hypothetical protein [bacterium]
PAAAVYEPAEQFMHKLPDKYSPAGQIIGTQALTAELPLGEVVPAGHVAQIAPAFMHPVTCTSAKVKVR